MKNKKLCKSSKKKMIFGVCGGFSDYFNIDVTIVRLLFFILACIKGMGFILYLVCAIIMPSVVSFDDEKSEVETSSKNSSSKKGKRNSTFHSDSEFDSFFKN